MKKLVFMVVTMVAMTFAACGGQTNATTSANDSDSVVIDSTIVDSLTVDSVVADTVVAE